MQKLKAVIGFSSVVAFLMLVLFSCGGGGGGSKEPDRLTYAGNTEPAVITSANATLMTSYVFGTGEITELSPVSALSTSPASYSYGMLPLMGMLQTLLQNATEMYDTAGKSTLSAATSVDKREPCYPSGAITYKGTIYEQNGTGNVTITFDACQRDDTFINGVVKWRIDDALRPPDLWMPLDSTFTFHKITVVAPQTNIVLDGTLRDQRHPDGSQTLTLNSVLQDNETLQMYKMENVVTQVTYVDHQNFSQTIDGRFYDSRYGHIDIATIQPLVYAYIDPEYPLNGRLQLTGANRARLIVTVLSEFTALLELDLNNDMAYEIAGEIPWQVIDAAGSDPGDADGDGMPDDWEEAHGFRNDTYADAGADADGDGLSNYEEYLLGTDPNVSEATPA